MTEKLWEVPKQWQWAVLKELGDIVSGATPSTKEPEYWGGDIVWFAPSDLTGYKQKFISRGAKTLTEYGLENSSARTMPAGSVMFSSRAPVGYVAINSVPAATNQGFKSLVPHIGIFNEYVYYYLKASRELAQQRATGTTFKEISGAAFGVLPIPIAPTNEQRRIVEKIEALFDEIDKGVESLNAAKTSLALYRQSLLKAAFEGRLTAEWRTKSADKLEDPETLLSRIKSEREDRYQSALEAWEEAVSDWRNEGEKGKKPAKPKLPKTFPTSLEHVRVPLPELPLGWRWAHLGWCSLGPEYGTAAKSSDSGDVPVIRMGNLQGGRIDWDDLVYTSDQDEIDQYLLNSGDVLFNRTNSPELVGKTSIYRGEQPALFAGYLVRVNQIEDIVSGPYLTYFLNSPLAYEHGRTVKTDGVNQSNINASKLQEYPFPYCRLAEQAEIVLLLDAQLDAFHALEEEIDAGLLRADALRQSILKKAFAGELVSQDPEDEPAQLLLERIKVEKAENELTAKRTRKSNPVKKAAARRPTLTDLIKVLEKHKGWVAASKAAMDLKVADGATSDEVEAFYRQLKDYLERGLIEVERRGDEDWLRLAKVEVG